MNCSCPGLQTMLPRSREIRAVYASTDIRQVLLHATLNRGYLSRVLTSYTIGYERRGLTFRCE
jgi:hypothetical protein